jgi:hypothetical protein
MFNDNEEVSGANTWTFARTDCEGNLRTTTFTAESWIPAIQEFVYFLKGNGFLLNENSIRLNDEVLTDDWFGQTFSSSDTLSL